jgi:hypothetical protein
VTRHPYHSVANVLVLQGANRVVHHRRNERIGGEHWSQGTTSHSRLDSFLTHVLQIANIYARNKEGASDSRHALFRRRANQLKKATSDANKET